MPDVREVQFSVKWHLGRSMWPSHLQLHPERDWKFFEILIFKNAPVSQAASICRVEGQSLWTHWVSLLLLRPPLGTAGRQTLRGSFSSAFHQSLVSGRQQQELGGREEEEAEIRMFILQLAPSR